MVGVLSIQSHVVHGCVGNTAAVLPMQLLGLRVDCINTVQFSNHTGYPKFTGHCNAALQIKQIVDGLRENSFLKEYSTILSGYVGNPETLLLISDLIQECKLLNPDIFIVIDPVMGDNNRLYVPQSCVTVYKTLIQYAEMVTPNAFEAQILTGIEASFSNVESILKSIHDMGPRIVIVTSMESDLETWLFASIKDDIRFKIKIPKVYKVHFTGTGDLFVALLIGYIGSDKTTVNVRLACEVAVSTMQIVLKTTFVNSNGSQNCSDLELDIIACRTAIMDCRTDVISTEF